MTQTGAYSEISLGGGCKSDLGGGKKNSQNNFAPPPQVTNMPKILINSNNFVNFPHFFPIFPSFYPFLSTKMPKVLKNSNIFVNFPLFSPFFPSFPPLSPLLFQPSWGVICPQNSGGGAHAPFAPPPEYAPGLKPSPDILSNVSTQ